MKKLALTKVRREHIFFTVLGFMLLSLLITSLLAYSEDEEKEKGTKAPITIMQNQTKWSNVKDNQLLKSTLQNEIAAWNSAGKSIQFKINTPQKNTYIGYYKREGEWQLKGDSNQNKTFVLRQDGSEVTLDFDGKKEQFDPSEFFFLLPIKHYSLLSSILEKNAYELIQWTPNGLGWDVNIRTSSETLDTTFKEYLSDYINTNELIDKNALESYTLHYYLHIGGHKKIDTVQFFLEKNGAPLEDLSFHF
jgi:hypothetical protein